MVAQAFIFAFRKQLAWLVQHDPYVPSLPLNLGLSIYWFITNNFKNGGDSNKPMNVMISMQTVQALERHFLKLLELQGCEKRLIEARAKHIYIIFSLLRH